MSIQMRPFTRHDWDCFSGAEKGPKGQTPAIGQIQLDFPNSTEGQAFVLVDGAGVGVYWYEDEEEDVYWHLSGVTFAAGLAIAAALVEPLARPQLEALGFVDVTGGYEAEKLGIEPGSDEARSHL